MTPESPSSQSSSSPWVNRLVEQLQQLSQVTENLTYRLLELEERLVEGERELGQLREQAAGGQELPPAVESWLEETEQRLVRVEELLRRGESRPASGRPLVAVATPLRPVDAAAEPALDASVPVDHDPFPEEGEQPFLDEQIA